MNKLELRNHLLTGLEDIYGVFDELFKLSCRTAIKGGRALYLSVEAPASFKNVKEIKKGANLDALSRITLMYFNSVDEIANKLIELHSWYIKPDLIVLDFLSISDKIDKGEVSPKKICQTIGRLFYLVEFMSNHLEEGCFSVCFIDGNKAPTDFLQIITDLYYYKSAHTSLESLSNLLRI